MPQLTDDQLQEMLSNIPDPALRARYETLATSADVARVYCMSETCKGRQIGVKNSAGQWVSTNQTKTSGLLSSRDRFDGHTGFRCRCGNSSITSEAETGVITGEAPSRNDLAKIYSKQKKSPAAVIDNEDGTTTVDNFKIEIIRSIE